MKENRFNYNALSIFEWKYENWIVVDFNHEKNTIRLAKWLHPIKDYWIRGIMPLESEIEMARVQFENEASKLLLAW